MKVNYQGHSRKQKYFEGWYLKHQTNQDTIALIPGIHMDEHGEKSAFIQVITNHQSWYIPYLYEDFKAARQSLHVKIGNNIFSNKGVRLNIQERDITLTGTIQYGMFDSINYDIMGPFSILPFMECNHGILSMGHSLKGTLTLNGTRIDFNQGIGYLEKDCGKSFPKNYFWTQCNQFEKDICSITAAVADIPFVGLTFRGNICVIHYRNKEFRLATYLGAIPIQFTDKKLVIRQFNLTLVIDVLDTSPLKLVAPSNGKMERTIYENAACKIRYRLYKNRSPIFDLQSSQASFEFVKNCSENDSFM